MAQCGFAGKVRGFPVSDGAEFFSEVMSWNIPVEVGALCRKKHGLRGFLGGKQKNVDKKTGGAEGQIDKLVENFRTFFAEKNFKNKHQQTADVPWCFEFWPFKVTQTKPKMESLSTAALGKVGPQTSSSNRCQKSPPKKGANSKRKGTHRLPSITFSRVSVSLGGDLTTFCFVQRGGEWKKGGRSLFPLCWYNQSDYPTLGRFHHSSTVSFLALVVPCRNLLSVLSEGFY